jgi:hypothetical protein
VAYENPPLTLLRKGERVSLPNINLAYHKDCMNDYQACLIYPSDK